MVVLVDNFIIVEGVYLGWVLFFDLIFFVDSMVSCGICYWLVLVFIDGVVVSSGFNV